MKRADWFVVVVLMMMGIACLISAASFRGMFMSRIGMGISVGWACFLIPVLGALVWGIYWFINRRKQ
ncbi:hypothetical protein [Paenibacillus pinistramenti]|uniref:hypothetical protein n=1 Tax=Paenibacillus pinistramenti TaxID=1768003 RepID=UPI00110900D3|nr:hypothetical protein [Paenibacillus pinistramenti]